MQQKVKNKRPFAFYINSSTFSFERASYYATKFLMYYFITDTIAKGGLNISEGTAGIMQSFLVAFTYLAPVLMGFISDRFIGARYTIPAGLALMGLGYILGSQANSLVLIWVMILLVSIGTGLFKGNISALNGTLFKDKEQLDSAFSTQYSFVNIGSFISTTILGVLLIAPGGNGTLGYKICLIGIGILCFIGAAWFVYGWRFLGDHGRKPFIADKGLSKNKVAEDTKPLTKSEKKKVFAIVLISLFSVIFWIFWYLTYLAVYDYGEKFVNWTVGGFHVPIAWFDSLNAFMCIALGPVLGILWFKLSQRPKGDMSLFKKLGIGLIFLGASFFMLVFGELTRGVGQPDTVKANLIWILLFGILLSLGEMFFSPLGNSFVTKYAPKRILSTLMGVWIVATFIASISYGYIYAWSKNFDFIKVYTIIPIILFISAVILFIFDKKLTSMVEGND